MLNKVYIIYAKKEFSTDDEEYCKVRFHYHYTGKYRGVAHNTCNLRYKMPKQISVVFDNGCKYGCRGIARKFLERGSKFSKTLATMVYQQRKFWVTERLKWYISGIFQ